MNVYLSTCLKSETVADGKALVEAMTAFGVSGLELDYRIRPEAIAELGPALLSAGYSVSSVHNFFPVPDIRPRRPGGGDFFNLASLDADEQREAVKWTVKTLEHAADFEADAVVVHCGRVDMDHRVEQMQAYAAENRLDSEEAANLIKAKTAELEQKKPAHVDSLMFSLDKLLESARRLNVRLGIENRNHYHELPGPDDFAALFAEFDGGPIGYWHDTGHAHVNEMLSFHTAAGLLERFGDRLIGVHIHDAAGFSDHLPPGRGEIDFAYVLPYLKGDVKCVLEILPGTPDGQVMEGISWFNAFTDGIEG